MTCDFPDCTKTAMVLAPDRRGFCFEHRGVADHEAVKHGRQLEKKLDARETVWNDITTHSKPKHRYVSRKLLR